MAGAGYKLFNTGDVLTAAQVNTYLMEQTVMVFANAAARTTALSGVVSEGMISYLKDTNAVEVYDGSNWVSSDDPNAIQNTIVDAKGDLIAASAADTPARLAVGNNGETLVADSSTSTGLRYQAAKTPNGVINGAFDFWQRGTSFGSTPGVYTADRWFIGGNSGFTYSQQLPGSTLPQFRYCMRLQRNNGSSTTAWLQVANTFETSESLRYAGKTVVISFWARKSSTFTSTSSALQSQFNYGTGTDQRWDAFTGSTAAGSLSATLTTSWQRFSYTATVPTTATEVFVYFAVTDFAGTAGASDWAEVTGVQVEVGSVPTEFSRAGGTLAGELLAAQRYYYRTSGNGGYRRFGAGQCYGTGNVVAYISFPVTMRTNPTALEQSGTASHYAVTNSTAGPVACNTVPSFDNANNNGSTVLFTTASGLTAGNATTVMDNNTSSAYLGWSAEL